MGYRVSGRSRTERENFDHPGMERLKACDAVVYDHLASQELLGFVRKDCRIIYAGKEAGSHSMPQEEINRLLIGLAKEGVKCSPLKGRRSFCVRQGIGGDPGIKRGRDFMGNRSWDHLCGSRTGACGDSRHPSGYKPQLSCDYRSYLNGRL